jgi:hypothetical protein
VEWRPVLRAFHQRETLVLLSPVVPTQVGAAPVPLAVDLSKIYPLPAFTDAKNMFYPTMSNSEAKRTTCGCDPSPRRRLGSHPLDDLVHPNAITMPILCVGAGVDTIVPA